MDKLVMILEAACGDRSAASELLPLVYDELRNLASKKMSQEDPGQTLQATALVHEAWLRLTKEEAKEWNDKAHFFRAAAQAMRNILVNRAIAKSRQKRGTGATRVDITGLDIEQPSQDDKILQVDEALKQLEAEDPDSARVISLKFFAGMTNKEIAEMDGVSERTIERQWAYARGILFRKISGSEHS
jgi:RNA polymerase sigma factor (TIGR02999 family)